MSRLGTITRRTFIVGTAAIAGGIAFGYYAYKKPVENPLLDGLGAGEAAITPYVKIDESGVTIITPRADSGQGVYSVQAALVAEELDVELADISIDPGVPSAAYFNGKVIAEGLPFASTDMGTLAKGARTMGHVLGKLMGVQVTGGSSTVADAYEKLRIAGAVARETLKQVAAEKSGLSVDVLRTEKGHVVLPDGTSIPYTALAGAASMVEPVSEVTLRDQSDWRYLTKSMQRIDTVAKSTGTLTYGIDLRFDDMVFATVRTNPRLGGGVRGYDARDARTARGVIDIIPVTGGAAVVADNTWRAFAAADMIDFDWGEAPYPHEQADLWDAVSSAFTKDQQDSRFKDEGDVVGLTDAPDTISAEYRIPYLGHAPLEPMNAVVKYDGVRLDVWTGTQIPLFMIGNIERLHGIPAEHIHIHNQYMGGSFGRRLEDDYVQQAVEIALAMPNMPIKMTWSRQEDMTHDFPRPMQIARARGAVKNGRVDGFDLGIAAASTTASQLPRIGQPAFGPDIAIVAGAWDQPLAIPNYRVTGYRAPTTVPVSSWRSVGASGNAFFHNGFLDELFRAAGVDPLEELLRLCSHDLSTKVLEAAGEMSNWGSQLGPNRGRGIAFTVAFGVPTAEVVEVTNTPQGIKIDAVYVAAEVGKVIDPDNFQNQAEGGVIWALGHAMNCEMTYSDGMAEQTNFHAYEAMRLYQAPKVIVRALENGPEVRGIGEPTVPPAAPALANAIFDATGQRIREMPMNKHIEFV